MLQVRGLFLLAVLHGHLKLFKRQLGLLMGYQNRIWQKGILSRALISVHPTQLEIFPVYCNIQEPYFYMLHKN